MANSQPVVLSIAGYDPSSGAGVTADIKTLAAHGCYGVSCITALTVQSTTGVTQVQAVSGKLVADTLHELAKDFQISAVRIGMLGSAEVVVAVAEGMARRRLAHYVLDPVMVASSGDRLLEPTAECLLRDRLVPLAELVTPNLAEARILVDHDVATPEQMERAGRALLARGAQAALIKGGHLAGEVITDVLVTAGGTRRFTHPRIDTTSTHGTGCTLSAAVTAGLAHGRPLEQAVTDALDFVQRAIAAAPGLGRGRGPLNHFVPGPPRPPSEGL